MNTYKIGRTLVLGLACFGMITLSSCEKDLFDGPNDSTDEAVILPADDEEKTCDEWFTFVERTPCHGLTFVNDVGLRFQVFGLETAFPMNGTSLDKRVRMSVTSWEPAIICMALPPSPLGKMVRVDCINGRKVDHELN